MLPCKRKDGFTTYKTKYTFTSNDVQIEGCQAFVMQLSFIITHPCTKKDLPIINVLSVAVFKLR